MHETDINGHKNQKPSEKQKTKRRKLQQPSNNQSSSTTTNHITPTITNHIHPFFSIASHSEILDTNCSRTLCSDFLASDPEMEYNSYQNNINPNTNINIDSKKKHTNNTNTNNHHCWIGLPLILPGNILMSNIGYTFECLWCCKKISYIEPTINNDIIEDAILINNNNNNNNNDHSNNHSTTNITNDISINEQCRTIYESLNKRNIRLYSQKKIPTHKQKQKRTNKKQKRANVSINDMNNTSTTLNTNNNIISITNNCSSNVSYSRIPHNLNCLQLKDRVMGYDYKNDTYCLAWIQDIHILPQKESKKESEQNIKQQVLIHYEDWGRKWDQWFIINNTNDAMTDKKRNELNINSIKPRSDFYHYSRFIVNDDSDDRYFATSMREQMVNYGDMDVCVDDVELAMMHVSLKKQKHCFSVISKNSSLFVEEFTSKQIAIYDGQELNLDPAFMAVVSVGNDVGGDVDGDRMMVGSIVCQVFGYLLGMDMEVFEYLFGVCGGDVQVFIMVLKALKTPNKIQKYYDLLLVKEGVRVRDV